MSETVAYRPKAGEIPTEPGVYRFKDAKDRILYVGKANNLRARLSNYFVPLASLHERTRRMVTTASSVEWTVVGSEFEALQLEFTWIKEFDPPFNVKFRDDKTYPYLAITLQEEVPRVLITRNKGIRGARYFGPYTKVGALRETVDLMLKAFPMRSCTDTIYRRAEQSGRPCLLGDIGKCSAPCVGRVSKGEHKSTALDFASFMAGQDRRYVNELTTRMTDAAQRQDYETAARFRDQRAALEAVLSKNSVVLSDSIDADLFGIAHDELAAAVQQFSVRGGRIRGVRSWVVDKELDLDLPDLVESVLQKAYGDDTEPPRRVIVPALPDDASELEHWLATRRWELTGRSGRSTLSVARRGELAALAQTVDANAKNALILYKTRRSGDFTARSQALADIQSALGMADAPLRMECFDVSHLSGTNIVASMVVFEDGLPRKDQYRKFSIQDVADDTEAIADVVRRRLAHLDDDEQPAVAAATEGAAAGAGAQPDTEVGAAGPTPVKRFAYRPNLLIVDGGQPQVAAAARVLAERGITDVALCGIAKRLEEIWLPDSEYPVILPRNSEALFLIQRIRDEAHRFAISFQRQRRRRDISTVLSEIPGVGPSRVTVLLKHFGSVARLRQATPEQIAEVKGVGPVLAQTIHARLAAPDATPSAEGVPAGSGTASGTSGDSGGEAEVSGAPAG